MPQIADFQMFWSRFDSSLKSQWRGKGLSACDIIFSTRDRVRQKSLIVWKRLFKIIPFSLIL